jgi:hypothetical protein
MSAFNFFDITSKFSTFTMLVMFTDELLVGFEVICSIFTGYPALVILPECCAINIVKQTFLGN